MLADSQGQSSSLNFRQKILLAPGRQTWFGNAISLLFQLGMAHCLIELIRAVGYIYWCTHNLLRHHDAQHATRCELQPAG